MLDDQPKRLAEFFSAFADPGRIRIMQALLPDKELCVKDIASAVESSESAVSHQLKTLRLLRLVSARQQGRRMLYSLDDSHISEILESGIDHINE